MIFEEDLHNLPEDPIDAFIYIELLARRRLDEELRETENSHWVDEVQRKYANYVIAAAHTYGIEELAGAPQNFAILGGWPNESAFSFNCSALIVSNPFLCH